MCSAFFNEGCGCNNKCSTTFSQSYLRHARNQMAELAKDELDLVVIGEIAATMHDGTTITAKKHRPKERDRPSMHYQHRGQKVWQMNSVLINRKLTDLCKHLSLHSWIRAEDYQSTPSLLKKKCILYHSYRTMQKHMPYCYLGGYQGTRGWIFSFFLLAPPNTPSTYMLLLQRQLTIGQQLNLPLMVLWRRYLPHVVVTKAASDLCWVCKQNSTALIRSQSSTLQVQSQVHNST